VKRAILALALSLAAVTGWAAPWQGFSALALSPDGRWFATGGREGEVLVWETSTGEIQARWTLAGLPVAGLAFSPDGTAVAAVLLDGSCTVLKPSDGSAVAADTKGAWKVLADAPARALSRSPALSGVSVSWKDLQAKGSPDGTVTVTPFGGKTVTWQAHQAAVTALAFAPDGTLLTAGYDGTLGRWDPRTGRSLGRL
jgi:WD40 repeat protein